jgi:hypothetical protein
MIRHCIDCEPIMPPATTIVIATSKLSDPITNGLFKKIKE